MKTKVFALAALMFLSAMAQRSLAGGAADLVVPPDQSYKGLTYGEWGEVWWMWANTRPVDESPLFDLTGKEAANGQFGDVWFLAGVFGLGTTWATPIPVERSITVPEGKSLFFPILNNETNPCEWPWDPINPPTIEQMYYFNAYGFDGTDGVFGVANGVSKMFAEIDGVSVGDNDDLLSFRGTSPAPFWFWLPPGDPDQIGMTLPVKKDDRNLEQYWGVDVSGFIHPVVSDGYWLMIQPLPVGKHTIHFGGQFGEGDTAFYMDITYHIKVLKAK